MQQSEVTNKSQNEIWLIHWTSEWIRELLYFQYLCRMNHGFAPQWVTINFKGALVFHFCLTLFDKSSQGNNKKIRLYPYWFPSQNQPFLHLISCCDEIQGKKLDQIKSHAFLQHSTLWLTQHVLFVSLLYEVVVNNYEKCQNSTSENSRVFPLSDLTEKIKFFCSSIFPFSVLICSHTSLHACCNNMGTSKVTHYMQTSPDKIFSLQNLRTSKVQVHCYIGEQLSCLVLSEVGEKR